MPASPYPIIAIWLGTQHQYQHPALASHSQGWMMVDGATAQTPAIPRDFWSFLDDDGRRAGGGSGIRTRDRVAPIHALQACAFDRSATPPRRLVVPRGAAAAEM